MTADNLISKFAEAGNNIELTEGDVKAILKHVPAPGKVPTKAFSTRYWKFLAQDYMVLRNFVLDWRDAMMYEEELDSGAYQDVEEEWMGYLDDAINWYCEERNCTLISNPDYTSDDHYIFVSDKLIDKGLVKA